MRSGICAGLLVDLRVTAKIKLLALGVLLTLFACIFYSGYLKGWNAHSEHVNSQAKAKQKKAESGQHRSQSDLPNLLS